MAVLSHQSSVLSPQSSVLTCSSFPDDDSVPRHLSDADREDSEQWGATDSHRAQPRQGGARLLLLLSYQAHIVSHPIGQQ